MGRACLAACLRPLQSARCRRRSAPGSSRAIVWAALLHCYCARFEFAHESNLNPPTTHSIIANRLQGPLRRGASAALALLRLPPARRLRTAADPGRGRVRLGAQPSSSCLSTSSERSLCQRAMPFLRLGRRRSLGLGLFSLLASLVAAHAYYSGWFAPARGRPAPAFVASLRAWVASPIQLWGPSVSAPDPAALQFDPAALAPGWWSPSGEEMPAPNCTAVRRCVCAGRGQSPAPPGEFDYPTRAPA